MYKVLGYAHALAQSKSFESNSQRSLDLLMLLNDLGLSRVHQVLYPPFG